MRLKFEFEFNVKCLNVECWEEQSMYILFRSLSVGVLTKESFGNFTEV